MTIAGVSFNVVDLVVLVILLIGGIGGALSGFIVAFSRTAGYVVGFLASLMFTVPLADRLMQGVGMGQLPASLTSFVLLFLVGYLAVGVLAAILETVVDMSGVLAIVNGLAGFFWGMAFAFLVVGVVCYLLQMQHLIDFTPWFSHSQFVTRFIQPLLPKAIESFAEKIH